MGLKSSMLLFTHGWTAVSHQIIKGSLCPFRVDKIPLLQHLTVVIYHLFDCDRVMFAIIGSIKIDTADIFVLLGQLAQPGAPQHLLAGYRAYPDLAAAYVIGYFRSVRFPRIYFGVCYRQATVAVKRATLAALITVFHEVMFS
jgi:hypothetical protein